MNQKLVVKLRNAAICHADDTYTSVKRLLREAWRELAPEMRTGFDVVLVARNACTAAKTAEVTASLRKAARGVGLLKEGGAK